MQITNRCEVCGAGYFTGDCGCRSVLALFATAMEHELRDNNEKGGRHGKDGRGGWASARPEYLLAELHDHEAKLHIAARELQRRQSGEAERDLPWGNRTAQSLVVEFAADTANMALMLCDAFGLFDEDLIAQPNKETE